MYFQTNILTDINSTESAESACKLLVHFSHVTTAWLGAIIDVMTMILSDLMKSVGLLLNWVCMELICHVKLALSIAVE